MRLINTILLFTIFRVSLYSQDTIYIAQEAWHTGLIIKKASISSDIFPEISNYKRSSYIDIGWGDEKFYQHPRNHVGLAARAILFPTSSVIRMIGFHKPVEEFYKNSKRVQIVLDSAEFNALCRFVSESFIRNENGNIMASSVYGPNNIFFIAKRKYHLFRTCNTWIALALKEAGLDIRSAFILNARQLFRQLRRLDNAVYFKPQ